MYFKEIKWEVAERFDWIKVAGFNEPSCCINLGRFLDLMATYQLLKEDCTPLRKCNLIAYKNQVLTEQKRVCVRK